MYRSAAGEPEGLVRYSSDDAWGDSKTPLCTASVHSLIALTPAAERALWQYVCSIDWIATVRTGHRAPDDLVTRFLPDPRAARVVTNADYLWVRILDVVRALEARTYAVPGSLVLEVVDGTGLASGRFRLDASGTGDASATCTPTTVSPDVVLDVRELGALYLGDESALVLSALGALTEETPGAAARMDVLFCTSRRPWCPDIF